MFTYPALLESPTYKVTPLYQSSWTPNQKSLTTNFLRPLFASYPIDPHHELPAFLTLVQKKPPRPASRISPVLKPSLPMTTQVTALQDRTGMVEERYATSRLHLLSANADIAYSIGLVLILTVSCVLPAKTPDDTVRAYINSPAPQETDIIFYSLFGD
jgi:hypothetical protein